MEVRDDPEFESRVRASARARMRRAHGHTGHTRSEREAEHSLLWRRRAFAAAALAFGIGVLWPVAPQQDGPPARIVRAERVLGGEQLASLESPSPKAR